MTAITQKNLINGRLLTVLFLGFASGLPLALIGSTLQAWFTEANVGLQAIGAISLLGIPYALKFLWAPLMDHFRFPGLGGRQGWILITQVGLVTTLFVLAHLSPGAQAGSIYVLELCIAFLSASQDIAIDAYRTDILHADERGLGSAYYIFTYRLATLVSGGLALIMADDLGWKMTYEIMSGILLVAMIPTYYAPQSMEVKFVSPSLFKTISTAFFDLIQRKRIIFLFFFLVF